MFAVQNRKRGHHNPPDTEGRIWKKVKCPECGEQELTVRTKVRLTHFQWACGICGHEWKTDRIKAD